MLTNKGKRMKRILTIATVVLATWSASAQQDPQFTQWFNDKQSFNPGAVGIREGHCISGFFRNQWSGFTAQSPIPGQPDIVASPNTVMLNYAGRIQTPGLQGGMGLTFYNDQIGQETNNMIRGMFAYHLNAGPGTLSIGLGVGFFNKQLGNAWLPPEGVTSIPDDNAINSSVASDGAFDMSFGLYYFKEREYYFGISTTHITQSELADLSIQTARHYYLMGGYNFGLNDDLVLRTNLLAKSDFNKSAIDINANVLWNDMIYGGVSFRPGDAIAPVLGLEYCTSKEDKTSKSLICYRLGYSYDVTTSEIRNFSSGSHEIFAGVCFSYQSIPLIRRHANPRFL